MKSNALSWLRGILFAFQPNITYCFFSSERTFQIMMRSVSITDSRLLLLGHTLRQQLAKQIA